MGGEFYLEMAGKTYPVMAARDVSISGIGIGFGQAVERNVDIRLHYRAEDLRLAIKGRVAWCAENSDASADGSDLYLIGIEFDPGNGDHNSLLFMALRKYLDDFE